MQIFGYIRVSTREQNEDRQVIALEPFGIPAKNVFMDKQSGKDFKRPAYRRMLKKMKRGDLLYIKSIDRLGRSYAEIIQQWRVLTRDRGVDIKILDMPLLDTTYCKDLLGTFISDLVLQVMSFSAQLERETLLQRQAEGIAAAKARGVRFGRAAAPIPDNFEELVRLWRSGKLNVNDVATRCGFSRRTLYEKSKDLRNEDHRMKEFRDLKKLMSETENQTASARST